MEALLDKEAVASILGVEPRTLDNWASQRRGPVYVKVGGRRMYDPADVREWVDAHKVGVTDAEVRRNLEQLRALGLVDYDIATDRYRVNDLGRRALAERGDR